MSSEKLTQQGDSLIAAIEGNFAGMSKDDLIATCEMLTSGRASWRKDAEQYQRELIAAQQTVSQLCIDISSIREQHQREWDEFDRNENDAEMLKQTIAQQQRCSNGHRYIANSHEYPCPYCENVKLEQTIAQKDGEIQRLKGVVQCGLENTKLLHTVDPDGYREDAIAEEVFEQALSTPPSAVVPCAPCDDDKTINQFDRPSD